MNFLTECKHFIHDLKRKENEEKMSFFMKWHNFPCFFKLLKRLNPQICTVMVKN